MDELQALRLETTGAQLYRKALPESEVARLQALAEANLFGKGGHRIFGGTLADAILEPEGAFDRLAVTLLGAAARPVRAILFDKKIDANWAVGWHQDRTIAVQDRRDVEGFGPWSQKDGALHVEPPFEILGRMVTMRAHLDDCDVDNAPLLIAPGSHRLGRVPLSDVPAAAERCGTVACLADCGDIWVYATAIVHGSQRAARPRRRRVLQVDYAAEELPGGLRWLGV